MTVNSFSTEAQTIAVGLVSDAIKQSYIPLFDKLKELESHTPDEETSSKIDIVKIRLDVLFKVEMNLLIKIQEEYTSLGQNPGDTMNKARKNYDSQFRLDAAQLVVDQSDSVRQACESMGVSKSSMDNWVRPLNQERRGETPKASALSADQHKIQELEKRIWQI